LTRRVRHANKAASAAFFVSAGGRTRQRNTGRPIGGTIRRRIADRHRADASFAQ
jgi:hypothetical protein